MKNLQLLPKKPLKPHAFFVEGDILQFDDYALINHTEKIAKTPFPCFYNHTALEMLIMEEEPAILIPMISEEYDEFICGAREAFIFPSEFHFEHEDSVFLIRVNDNFYPSGHWVNVDIRVIECSIDIAPIDGLTPGYSLVQLNRTSFDEQPLKHYTSFS